MPPTVSDDGYHSWRTLILPFCDDDIDKSVNLDSPWNSEANQKLHRKIPHGFQCHNREDGSGSTQIFAVTGHGSIWSIESFKSDSNSLLLIELDLPNVCWMEPTDVSMDELIEMLEASGELPGPHPDGILMAFADFSVRFVPHEEITQKFLRSLVEPDAATSR